jgi:hypothetical protein
MANKKEEEITSSKNELIKEDIARWFKNLLIFSSPALILFLTSVQAGDPFEISGKILLVALINALIDLLRKFTGENQYTAMKMAWQV